jgi:hypothetical protein
MNAPMLETCLHIFPLRNHILGEIFNSQIIACNRSNTLVVTIHDEQHAKAQSSKDLVCPIHRSRFLYRVGGGVTIRTDVQEAFPIIFIDVDFAHGSVGRVFL